jgi:hypothetical protein
VSWRSRLFFWLIERFLDVDDALTDMREWLAEWVLRPPPKV